MSGDHTRHDAAAGGATGVTNGARTGASGDDAPTTAMPGPGNAAASAVPRRGMLAPLAALDRLIARLEAAVLAAGVILMAVLSVANVVGRFLFGQSIFFAEELNQFLIILITFFGIGYAARHGRHIRMTAFYDAMPDRARKALMVVIALITAAAMFVLAWYALAYVQSVYGTGRVAPALRVPIWVTLVWAPVGFVVTGIQYVMTAVVNLTRSEVYVSSSVVDSYDDSPTEV